MRVVIKVSVELNVGLGLDLGLRLKLDLGLSLKELEFSIWLGFRLTFSLGVAFEIVLG